MSLDSLINAAVERNGKDGGASTIVAVDLRQKTEFAVRGGNIEFFPAQDDDLDTRKKFVAKQFKDNRLSQRLEYCMNLFLTKGEVLWLTMPDEEGNYLIEFFHGGETDPDPEYKVFYKAGGRKIESVVICYPYKTSSEFGGFETERWVRLRLTEESIEYTDLSQKPSLNNISPNCWGYDAGSVTRNTSYPNPFTPTIPVVVCANNPKRIGQPGTSDYHWLKEQIESHDNDVAHIRNNLKFYGNPTLVTTRSAQEVTEAASSGLANPSWAGQQGYVDGYGDSFSMSSRVSDPLSRTIPGRGGRGVAERIARIIGGVSQDERFGYIVPDPVTGDLNQFQRQERELIHYALGGIDPLGISSGATAFEVKTLFGRVENTADGKADALYTHGLALVFEQILYFEEQVFKDSLFLGMTEAEPKRWKKLESPEQISDEIAQQLYQGYNEGKLKLSQPPQGIMPMGDRTILWRYTRPVFKNSTRELLDLSIASRNAREDGLSQEYCLRLQHPDMTDKEVQEAMSGFSPRVVENASNSITILLQIYQQFMQMPDPQEPTMPWAIRLGIPQMLDEALLTLQKELAYGRPTYDAAESSTTINATPSQLRISGGGSTDAPATDGTSTTVQSTPSNRNTYGIRDPRASMVAYGLPATAPNPDSTGQPAGGYWQNSGLPTGTGQPPSLPAPGTTISTQRSIQPNGYGADDSGSLSGIPSGIPAEFISNPYLWSLYAPQPTNSRASRKPKRSKG